jgi:hypothetical protein
MAKQSEKVAASKQPESRRGKSRFDVQPRSNRVVLPQRPPREVDNEIVSILLGGDPASLGVQVPDNSTSHVAEIIAPSPNAETAEFIEDLQPLEKTAASEPDFASHEVQPSSLSTSEMRQANANDSQLKVSPSFETSGRSSLARVNRASSARDTSVRNTSFPRSDTGKITAKVDGEAQDLAISSFEEFAERWKHGLRKGQLKVCEVLYQKTYALGVTECVTSFSELGRLSGLKMRQCFNIIAQLEALKFVERAKSETTSNKKDQGSIIRFLLFPRT